MPETTEQLLKRSTEEAQKAAKLIGGTFEQGRFENGKLVGGFKPLPTLAKQEPIAIEDIQNAEAPAEVPEFPSEAAPSADTLKSQEEIVMEEFTKPLSKEQEAGTEMNKRLLELMKQNYTKEAETLKLEEKQGLPGLDLELKQVGRQLRDLRFQQLELQNQSEFIPGLIQQQFEGRGATKAGIAPIIAGELRNNALQQMKLTSEALHLAASGSFLLDEYDRARSLVDRAIAMKYTPIENEIEYLTTAIELNKDLLEREYKERTELINARLADRAEQIQTQKEQELLTSNRKFAIAQNLREQGAGADLIKRVLNAGDEFEAQAIAGEFVPEISQRELLQNQLLEQQIEKEKLAQIKTKAETAKIIAETSGVTEQVADEFANIVGSVASTVSAELGAKRGQEVKSNLIKAFNSGDYSTAYNQIADAVEATLSGENETRFESSRIDFQVMSGLREAIQQYAAAGGDMGLLVGKEEEIKRKLGIDSGGASALAVQLWREFQTYRNIMTGAAFTEKESRDYAAVNPTLGKSLNLNMSVIDGALNQLENRITSTINSKISGADKIYKLLTGDKDFELNPETAPIGTILDIGGIQYRKLGEDKFEEI